MDSRIQIRCPHCREFVGSPNFLIHESKCKNRQHRKGQTEIKASCEKERKETGDEMGDGEVKEGEYCASCGILETEGKEKGHPAKCQYREQECWKCQDKFPRIVLPEHVMLCTNKKQKPLPFSYTMPEGLDDSDDDEKKKQPKNVSFKGRHPLTVLSSISSELSKKRTNGRTLNASEMQSQGMIYMLALMAADEPGRGLDEKMTKYFPVNKFGLFKDKIKIKQDGCVICCCDFEDEQNFMTLPCKHIFHPDCVKTWLEKNPTCPVCKFNFLKPEGPKKEEIESQVMEEYDPVTNQMILTVMRFA